MKKHISDPENQAYKISCVMGHMWDKHLRPIMPQVVHDDFDELAKELQGLTMDGGPGASQDGILYYDMDIDGETQKLTITKDAPAAGICTLNYARYSPHRT